MGLRFYKVNFTSMVGVLFIICSAFAYCLEKSKMETLKPVTCILIKYDCLGKGAHTSFYYKNEIKTIGGIARELCEKNVKPNSVLTFYHAADDSFYFTKDTFPERYLLFTVIGIAICFIPSLTKRVDDAIFRKSINHYSNPKNIKK